MKDDTISRQAAIDMFQNLADDDWNKDTSTTWANAFAESADMIEDLPSAQPQRGRWEMKPDPYGFFDEIPVCSECGCTTKMREVYKFCPNCGAQMDGGEQDEQTD